jgi:hypothetical protein
VFHRRAENLQQLETSGGYYGLAERRDKQFRHPPCQHQMILDENKK